MPHIRHEATENVPFDKLTDVSLTSPADGDVLEYDSASGLWLNVSPWETDRRVSTFTASNQVQAGPVAQWTPLAFSSSSIANGHGFQTIETAATNIIGTWTPVALPTTHIDVDDASGLDTTYTHKYITIDIPGSAKTVVRYESISIGGGAGGSDRITLNTSGSLGAGHRGIGTPAAGAAVKQSTVEVYDDGGGIAVVQLLTGAMEAITGGNIGWRLRSATGIVGYAAVAGVLNVATNTAEETAQVAAIAALGTRATSVFNGGLFIEFLGSVAGGTASQVRTDPVGSSPSFSYSDFGELLTS